MIYVGDLAQAPDRDSNWINAFRDLGCEVIPFKSSAVEYSRGIIGRVLKRLNIGRKNKKLQKDLIELAKCKSPDWIHFRLPIQFDRRTIVTLKRQGITVTQYMNDDPFSKGAAFGIYWKFHRALVAYDGHFVYRAHNIATYQKAGAMSVQHCPPTYDPRRHKIVQRDTNSDFLADVAFIGHWENDWRADCLESLAENGFRVIVRGGGWDNAIKGSLKKQVSPVTHAFGQEYNDIYANVLAGLCFFSKINNDSWTERALEIVAVGGLLVCERTDEAATYFKDREEAYFFSSIQELTEIVKELKNNHGKGEKVRRAGYARLLAGANTVDDRARQVLQWVKAIQENNS